MRWHGNVRFILTSRTSYPVGISDCRFEGGTKHGPMNRGGGSIVYSTCL